jgi:hypothetical protein
MIYFHQYICTYTILYYTYLGIFFNFFLPLNLKKIFYTFRGLYVQTLYIRYFYAFRRYTFSIYTFRFIRSDVICSDVIRSVFLRSDVIRSDVIRSVIIRSVGESLICLHRPKYMLLGTLKKGQM